ncbi:MAG: hypothetical protein IJI44_01850 [Erysipelotrichaceae bacterium]|nr:hypothetical protein [Erysipelotrichaceae bacterium]
MKVLIISHSLIPSVLLCGHTQLQYLMEAGKIEYRFLMAARINTRDLSWADIIVFVRSESDLEAYTAKLCAGKKHMVYVLDDDLLNLPDYVSSAKYYHQENIHNNILKIMELCNTFMTPSRVLLEKYGKGFQNSFLLNEPSLSAISKKQKNDKVRIGFAGSIDRTQDINHILEECLIKVMEKYGDKVSIEFMGARPKIVDDYDLKYIPYQDSYKKYTEIVQEANWDIGLAPMPDTPFHACKYFNKYVEYASFGIAGIYSDLKPYVYGIRNRENGLLVKNTTEDWYQAICLLIEDEKLRDKISRECIREANTVYSLETLSRDYFDKITYAYEMKTAEEIRGLWKFKIMCFFAKVVYKVKEQKWKLPFWMVYKLWKIVSGRNNKENTMVNLSDLTNNK